jgi:V/A-type H+-transporting ATPase subunit E
MAFEDIVKKINEDARAEAESLLSLARAESDAILEKAKKQAEEMRADLTQKSKERAKRRGARIETIAGLELRKDTLKEKKSLIEDSFERAQKEIEDLPTEKYLGFLKPIILSAVESGVEKIIPSPKHRNMFTADFLAELNNELGPQKGHLRLSDESGDFAGGFILRDGKKDTNLTLESLIKSQRDSLEPQIAGILFGKGR